MVQFLAFDAMAEVRRRWGQEGSVEKQAGDQQEEPWWEVAEVHWELALA